MNEEALRLTLETREVHFFSRSRQELWRKGETSGNVMRVRALRYDCDEDAFSLWSIQLARPAIPASARAFTAISRASWRPVPHEVLPGLERTLRARQDERPEGSYTVELLDDPELIGDKVQEEAEEVARAAREESDERVAEEAADLLYHLEVLMLSRGLPLAAALEVLDGRRG